MAEDTLSSSPNEDLKWTMLRMTEKGRHENYRWLPI
jgi:hypothetical protein